MKLILNIRDKEVIFLKKSAYLRALVNFVWTSMPFLVALSCFGVYIFLNGGQILEPEIAFVTLSYLNVVRMAMYLLPYRKKALQRRQF